MNRNLKVLIVSEHASAKFGGEAILPLHYFLQLSAKNIPTWLLVHERTRSELDAAIPQLKNNIVYIKDTYIHVFLWKLGQYLPNRVASFSTGLISRLYSQILQRRMIKRLISLHAVNIIHQPTPVSPKEPSSLFGFGIPVVIGPMNGGMNFPPFFESMQGRFEGVFLKVGRALSNVVNTIIPGKLLASKLLVANQRTADALPSSVIRENVELVIENGVDLTVWKHSLTSTSKRLSDEIVFVYMGRLVDWKAVDILLNAFAGLNASAAVKLIIVGDGDQREALKAMADALLGNMTHFPAPKIEFTGWLTQRECSKLLGDADVLVLPSLYECGGAVVLEAMALSKPVIATDWGGPSDYLDETCGILVKPTSKQALIDGFSVAMLQLVQSADLRLRLGNNARLKIEKHFDWSVKVDKMIQIYIDVLDQDRFSS
jgi:glycosyltransferase involved in cell wall biosynthesis